MRRLIVLLVLGVVHSLTPAGEPAQSDSSKGDVRSIEALEFMVGHWKGEGLGGDVEESWLAPRNGNMVGVFRLSGPDRGLIVMEPLIIEQTKESVDFRFRHFGPGMKAWEPSDGPLTFRLVEVAAGRAVFDAPDRAQAPGRMVYTVDGDRMRVDVSSVHADGSVNETMTVEFTRVRR